MTDAPSIHSQIASLLRTPPEARPSHIDRIPWDQADLIATAIMGIFAPDPARSGEDAQYQVQASYSTFAADPKEAVEIFFTAIQAPGSIVVEVFDEKNGSNPVAEFDGEELIALSKTS